MNEPDEIADDEVILRRVPPGPDWQAPGPRPASSNFNLRSGDVGISVSRLKITSPGRLLEMSDASSDLGWKVAAATAGQIRSLGLRLVSKPTNADPGHAEIESDVAQLSKQSIRRALSRLFQFVEIPPPESSAQLPAEA